MASSPPVTRRSLLLRGATALAGAGVAGLTIAGCRAGGPKGGQRRPLVMLAASQPDRLARVAAWNEARAQGAPLEIQHLADGVGGEEFGALAAGGSLGADLLWGDLSTLVPLTRRGLLAPLGERVRRDHYDLKRFMPAALQPAFGLEARLVALPDEVDARQLYFNRDHFDGAGIDMRAAGFDFERPAIIWEALRRANLDLLAAPGPRERTPFVAAHAGAPLELWGWQNGTAWLDDGARRVRFTSPAAVETLTWLVGHTRELGNADRAGSGAPEFPPVSRSGDAADQPAAHPFLRTVVSVCFESTRLVSTIAGWHAGFPLGYVEPPRRSAGSPLVSLSRAWGYALGRNAPDTAWDALCFVVGQPAILAGAAAAAATAPLAPAPGATAPAPRYPLPAPGRPLWYPPFSGQIAVDELLAKRHTIGSKLIDEARDHALEQLRHARFRPITPDAGAVWPVLDEAFQTALRGRATPAEALQWAEQVAQERLDRAWKSAASR